MNSLILAFYRNRSERGVLFSSFTQFNNQNFLINRNTSLWSTVAASQATAEVESLVDKYY